MKTADICFNPLRGIAEILHLPDLHRFIMNNDLFPEKIFCMSAIDEVVFCDVIEDGAKLVGMVTSHGSTSRMPRTIEKLSEIDGVLRVREARIIKLMDD